MVLTTPFKILGVFKNQLVSFFVCDLDLGRLALLEQTAPQLFAVLLSIAYEDVVIHNRIICNVMSYCFFHVVRLSRLLACFDLIR